MTCYMGEGEFICEDCYRTECNSCGTEHCTCERDREESRCIGGESDSPEHCAYCHRPLNEDFDLTQDGVLYVLDQIRSDLAKGIRNPDWRWEHGYYKGLGVDAVQLDWIELWIEPIKYTLPKRDQRMVDLFVQWRGPRELELARQAGNEVLSNTIIGH